MKAISPALPMAAPSRQSNGADASGADDVFSALIAAVIGAPVAGSPPPAAPSSSSPSATRADQADDAQTVAAASRSARSTDEATDATGAAKSADQAAPADTTRADRRSPTNPTAEHGTTSESASSASAPKAQPAAASTTEPKVSAGLKKAAAALADALAASKDEARPTNVGVAMTLAAAKPGSALTEGQLPAQLVAAAAATHAATEAVPLTAAPGVKPDEQPGAAAAGKPLAAGDKTPTQTTPLVTAARPDGAQGVAAPASTPQSAQLPTSSDSMATSANAAVAGSTTSDHPKPVDAKPATQDRPVAGDTAPHLDAQLSAQPPVPAATSTTPAGSVQQPQPTYTSGMVSQQIVQVVAPLRSAKNGDYTLSLQLHPADLGAVTVRVEVQQGVLSVHMSAEHAHGHDALNQSLADLRTQLQSNGVRTGDIVVAPKPSVAPQHQDPQHRNQHQQDQHQHTGGRHPQEAPMRNDTGAARRPGDRSSHHAPSQADDDALDVRI